MASVRLGKDLRYKIFKAAQKAYHATTTEENLDNETLEEIWRGVIDHPTHQAFSYLIAEHCICLEDFLHRGSLTHLFKGDKIRITGYAGENDHIYLDLPTTRESYIDGGYNCHNLDLNTLHLSTVQRLTIADKVKAVAEKRKQAETDEQNYRTQIRNLLDSCNTLKQLLEAQPSMKEFVDDDLLREMHKKVTRASQARERREIAKVDGDLINRVVLTSKLVA